MVRVLRMMLVLFVAHVLPVVLVPLVARVVPFGTMVPVLPVVVVTAVLLPLVLGGVRHVVLHVLVPSPCCPARR
ncbi:hypothetical protein [Kitasatospora purpeofusca]|uniref:hypothetical protein n=1 Tax=Kitasatospora purpeofusca TaxID=67352 RepID=UPI002A5A97EB|nr:hypothetical protein [Kitasatospora purpeofusca]MDY0816034.1 hypothetical protein [Kitasatospora purpeofusca]